MGFELLGATTDETRLLVHRERGYSIAIPGHPSASTPSPGASPSYDTIVTLADQPMELGVRLDTLPASTDLKATALALAGAYATNRAAAPPKVRKLGSAVLPTNAAGATATYPIGASLESLVVVARAHDNAIEAVYLTVRYTTNDITPIRWAAFRAAILTTQHWDATARTTAPALWPTDSTFALPGVTMRFTDAAWATAQAKAARVGAMTDDQTTALVQQFIELSNTDDPPLHPQHTYALGMVTRQLAMIGPTSAVEPLVENIDDIKTTHDLRSWCWQNIWAIGNRAAR